MAKRISIISLLFVLIVAITSVAVAQDEVTVKL